MNAPIQAGDGGTNSLGDVPPEERLLFGLGDPPAFLRRGMSVEDAKARVHKKCEAARDETLYAVRLRLRLWNRLVRERPSLGKVMSAAARKSVQEIGRAALRPGESSVAVAPPGWSLFPGKHWRAFVASVEDFNAKWSRFLEMLPLDDLHRAIDGYNRYYVLEKECAVRSPRTARLGFVPHRKPTAADLLAHFPLLPTPPAGFR